MNNDDLNGKRIMHIDTSVRFKQRGNTSIAFKIIQSGKHKGIGLKNSLKRELDRDLEADFDYARLYAICIYKLIRKELKEFDILVICNDEHFSYVKEYLDFLFRDVEDYFEKEITSIHELRKITGDNKIRSYADKTANSYRKRIFKSLVKKQEGVELNIEKINYKYIKEKWREIEENNVSG